MGLSKILYLILLFITPAYILTTHGEYILSGMYIGAMSILIAIEKSEKVRDIIRKIF